MAFNAGPQALCQIDDTAAVGFQENRHKLFSADTARQIATTNRGAKHIRNPAYDFIAGLVAGCH